MSIKEPKNFKEWSLNTKEIVTSIIDNSKLPSKGQFSYVDGNMSDAMTLAVAAVTGVIGMAPAGAFISSIFASVFTILYNKFNTEGVPDLWTSFSKHMDQVLDAAFSKDHQKDVLAVISALNILVSHYVYARNVYEKTKKTAPNYHDVRLHLVKQFNDLNVRLEIELAPLSQLRTQLYSVQDLGAFALVATIRILLLRDLIAEGKDWGVVTYTDLEEQMPFIQNNYYEHAITTFNAGISKIETCPLTGEEIFSKILEFRSYCARFVFDIIDSWFLFDKDNFENGGYKENVRYLWHDKRVGLPVNNNEVPKDYSNGSTTSNYYLTPLSQIKKAFDENNAEQYKHDLSRIKVFRDDNWIYAIQPEYNQTIDKVTENRFGSTNTTFSANNMVKTFEISKSFSQSSVKVKSDLVPRFLSIDNEVILPFNISSSASFKMAPGSGGALKVIYSFGMEENDATIQNHKVAKLFGHSRNLEALSHGVKNIIPTGDGCCDNLYIGYSPAGVISANNLYHDKPTCINAQKYISFTGNIQFKKDHVFPTVHSIWIPAKGSLTFDTQFAFSNTTVKSYKFGFRYHFKGRGNGNNDDGEIDIRDSRGIGHDTSILLPITKTFPTGYCEYNVVQTRFAFDLSKVGKTFTLYAKDNIFIHSIILTPQ